MAAPRVFVSHSHRDDAFTRRLVADLEAAGADVWVDVAGVGAGDFQERINQALASCEWFVLVLTPAALASPWVEMEVHAAIRLKVQGRIRAVIQILAGPVAQADIPATWRNFNHFDATRDYPAARGRVLDALGLKPPTERPTPTASPTSTSAAPPAPQEPRAAAPPVLPPEQFPPRLAQLGYTAHQHNGVAYILPPLCPVPAGAFLMGSDKQRDPQAFDDELPQHSVHVPAYRIARFPVTVAEYACFVRAGQKPPSNWRSQLGRLDHPVVSISWRDAAAYARWLAARTGQPWRLPSEAEWEKAVRWDPERGVSRLYPWGDAFDTARCNTSESGVMATTPVSSYPAGASPCGAWDMAGNVWEWTSSLFKPYPHSVSDGREDANSADDRALRGGSWCNPARIVRAAFRHNSPLAHLDVGFRLAFAPAGS